MYRFSTGSVLSELGVTWADVVSGPTSLILAGERLCSVEGSFLELPDCVHLVRGQLAISRTKDPWDWWIEFSVFSFFVFLFG